MAINTKNNKPTRKIILLFEVILAVITVILVYLYYTHLPQPTTQAYYGPRGYFTMTLPSSWQTTTTYGTEKRGIGTPHETASSIDISSLSSGDGRGITIVVYERAS